MAWDSSRPVPWQRLAREWLIYVGIMTAVFLLFMRDRPLIGIFAGLLISGPLYLGFGYVLAKFGYQRKTLKDMRAESAENPQRERRSKRKRAGDEQVDELGPRPKPAPTSRTGGGNQQASGRPGGSRKKRR